VRSRHRSRIIWNEIDPGTFGELLQKKSTSAPLVISFVIMHLLEIPDYDPEQRKQLKAPGAIFS
jgi:hypothetical protein